MSSAADVEPDEQSSAAFDAFLAQLSAGSGSGSAFADTLPINTGNPYAQPFKEQIIAVQADRATAPWQFWLDRLIVVPSLGLYAPWARSFLLNATAKTILFAGARFGNRLAPDVRLRGRIAALILLLVTQAGIVWGGWPGAVLVIAGALGLPALIWNVQVTRARALYFAGRSFRHIGNLQQAYVSYAWVPAAWSVAAWLQWAWLNDAPRALPLFFAVVLAGLGPLAHALHQHYMINALAWHGAGFSYEARPLRYYVVWAAALPGLLLVLLIAWFGHDWAGNHDVIVARLANVRDWLRGAPLSAPLTIAATTLAWVLVWGVAWWLYRALVAPVIDTGVALIAANHTSFLANHLHLSWRAADVAIHQLVNGLAVLCSFGIAASWARWRWTRFCAAHISVTVLDRFVMPVENLHEAKRGWIGW